MSKDRTARAREALARCDALANFSEGHKLSAQNIPVSADAQLPCIGCGLAEAPRRFAQVDAAGNLRGKPMPGLIQISAAVDWIAPRYGSNAGSNDGILGVVSGHCVA